MTDGDLECLALLKMVDRVAGENDWQVGKNTHFGRVIEDYRRSRDLSNRFYLDWLDL